MATDELIPAVRARASTGFLGGESRRKQMELLLTYLGIGGFVLVLAFPVVWMAITALKQNADLYPDDAIPFWFKLPPTLDNFSLLFNQTQFVRWIVNTVEIAVLVVAITLVVAVPAGYALARLQFPGSTNLGILIFLTYLVPSSLLFIPLSQVIVQLGLQDSRFSLVVVYPTFTIPFCTWLLSGFFKQVPREIEEAARVDGCSRLGAAIRVVLPVTVPGLLSVVIFAFTLSMQEFIYALTFVSTSAEKPVTLGITTDLVRGDVYFWGSLMGAALLVGVPVAILYNFFLDHFVAGITGGAIK
jgi:multiple sugar transport system permease protein